jgi:hypothetical protein
MRVRVRLATALLGGVLVAGACGGKGNNVPTDGGPGGNAGSLGAGGSIGGGGGAAGGLAACLDRPGELARPPSGRLPCDLIPPGLRL